MAYERDGSEEERSCSVPKAIPPFREALGVWARIGCLSFGGPAGQIALMHREFVDERRWISNRRFLHALNFCSFLPGPEAQQLATYLGWLMYGAKGGFAAGLLFILPGAFLMLLLSAIFAVFGEVPFVSAVFYGLQCAVLVLVVEALLRIARRALRGPAGWVLAGSSFVAIAVFGVPFPFVIISAGLAGMVFADHFGLAHRTGDSGTPEALIDQLLVNDPARVGRLALSARRAGMTALIVWAIPLMILLPIGGLYADIVWFFSKMAIVTFGGAYAVLAYVAQEAVQGYQWISPSDMLTGLGLAETTPGPLILVLQFVGFLAGYRAETGLNGMVGGLAGTVLTLWVTFAPCFAFVFLGAPLAEKVLDHRRFSGALAAITASIVGVIANLAVWFAVHVFFKDVQTLDLGVHRLEVPVLSSLDPTAVLIAALATFSLFYAHRGVGQTLLLAAAVGAVLRLVS